MKVLAVVPSLYDTSPGQRFRIEQWEPILREHGIELAYAPFETEELKAVLHQSGNMVAKFAAVPRNTRPPSREMRDLEGFALIYLFREAALLGPPWFERK